MTTDVTVLSENNAMVYHIYMQLIISHVILYVKNTENIKTKEGGG